MRFKETISISHKSNVKAASYPEDLAKIMNKGDYNKKTRFQLQEMAF